MPVPYGSVSGIVATGSKNWNISKPSKYVASRGFRRGNVPNVPFSSQCGYNVMELYGLGYIYVS
jgi:hypothetical protein